MTIPSFGGSITKRPPGAGDRLDASPSFRHRPVDDRVPSREGRFVEPDTRRSSGVQRVSAPEHFAQPDLERPPDRRRLPRRRRRDVERGSPKSEPQAKATDERGSRRFIDVARDACSHLRDLRCILFLLRRVNQSEELFQPCG